MKMVRSYLRHAPVQQELRCHVRHGALEHVAHVRLLAGRVDLDCQAEISHLGEVDGVLQCGWCTSVCWLHSPEAAHWIVTRPRTWVDIATAALGPRSPGSPQLWVGPCSPALGP